MDGKVSKLLIVFLVLVFLLALILIVLPRGKRNKIADISINGLNLNEKVTDRMKNLVMDGQFLYEYDNVGFDVDEEDRITKLYFLRTESGKEVYDIKKAVILYNKVRLTVKEDFDKVLGKGIVVKDEYFTYVEYVDEDNKLTLSIRNDEIYNVKVENTKK